MYANGNPTVVNAKNMWTVGVEYPNPKRFITVGEVSNRAGAACQSSSKIHQGSGRL